MRKMIDWLAVVSMILFGISGCMIEAESRVPVVLLLISLTGMAVAGCLIRKEGLE